MLKVVLKLKLYICQTLDGFIANTDTTIDFLDQFNDEIIKSPNPKIANSYQDFISNIENVVQGYTTYDQLNKLGYGDHYSSYNHYVLTRNHREANDPNVTSFVNFEMLEALELDDSVTFLVGGSQTIAEAFKRQLISTIIITQLPIFLGSGIRLFENIEVNPHLEIIDIQRDNRFFQVEYQVKYGR